MERTPLRNGTIIRFPDGNAYQIEELIGQGGSALVYEAVGVGENSDVHFAIKEIYPSEKFQRNAEGEITPIDSDSISAKSELIEIKKHILARSARISQEAYQLIQQVLPERNIYECAELISFEDSEPSRVSNGYVLMDSLKEKGISLQRHLDNYRDNGNTMSLDYATKIMEAVLYAYSSLHEKGFIHGDCQMNNILLLNPPRAIVGESIVGVELIDFGCGRKLEEDGKTAVICDSLYSTDGYRAPEILRHAANFRMMPACDVWSLGFLFLNILSEIPRWERLRRILSLSGSPFVITEYLQENPSDKNISDTIGLNCSKAELHFTNKILSRAMDNNPEERYQNAGEMLLQMQALRRCINGDISMGIDAYMLWNSSIVWAAQKAGPGLVQKIPTGKMTVYGQLGEGAEEPIVELLHKLGSLKDRNLYLHASGGAGKSFAVSELFNEYLESGIMIPLYLDMEKFTKNAFGRIISENKILDENFISFFLAEQYFEKGKGETRQIVRQIDRLLSDSSETIEYFLVLDNLHKVKADIYETVIQTINSANYNYINTWMVVMGRMDNPLCCAGLNSELWKDYLQEPLESVDRKEFQKNIEPKFEITNMVEIAMLPETLVVDSVSKLRDTPLTVQDIQVLRQQREPLGLPLFFNRYLEILRAHPDMKYLPNSTAELMMIYFNQLEYGTNKRDVHQILDKHLPYVAYQYMISEEGQHSTKAIEGWLRNSYGKTRYRDEYLGKFLNECVNNLAVLAIGGSGQIYFVHDCYLDYFAAVRIAEITKCAIDKNDISVFESVNHMWSDTCNLIWTGLCTMDISDGYIYRACGELEWLDLEYELLQRNIVDSRKYASCLPYNISQHIFSAYGEDDIDSFSSVRWKLLGAELDDPYAQFMLSCSYRGGKEIEKDEKKALLWLIKAANQGLSYAECMLGGSYYNGELVEMDKVKAVEWFRKAAEQGMPEAQVYLGYSYCHGEGVETDKEQGVYWYREAAEHGLATAQLNLGCAYYDGEGVEENKEQAENWLCKAATQGLPEAQLQLGHLYYEGEALVIDEERAIYWYHKAAEQGLAEAQFRLGFCYSHGERVEVDKEKAIYWYRKAAEQGYAEAQLFLAFYYDLEGKDESDKEKAAYWFCKAAEQGDMDAQYYLGDAYANGDGVEVDKVRAVYWYRKAAEQGVAVAQNNLGYAYFYGEGIEVNKEQAVYWYRKAAKQGLASAQNNLGYAYKYGVGIEVDKEQAVYWYREAAKRGHSAAQNNLANMLCDGIGCEQDYEEALYWFTEAWKQRNNCATNNLGWMYLNGHGVDRPDYRKAFLLFTEATEQGSEAPHKHLAEMYAQGLGVPIDLSLALEHYKKAKKLGATDVDEQIEQLKKQLSEMTE